MTRYEYAALARYWRVRRRAMRYGAHHERQLRRAEEDLARVVTLAFIAEKWAPTIKWLNTISISFIEAATSAFRSLAPITRQLAKAHAQAKEAAEE